jgi:hypothetical protein
VAKLLAIFGIIAGALFGFALMFWTPAPGMKLVEWWLRTGVIMVVSGIIVGAAGYGVGYLIAAIWKWVRR